MPFESLDHNTLNYHIVNKFSIRTNKQTKKEKKIPNNIVSIQST